MLATFIESNVTWIIIWVAVFVFALVVEFTTDQLISIWFCGSAVIALILAIFNVVWWAQLIVFAIVSGILLYLSRFIVKRKLKDKDVPTNSDSLIGQEIYVTKEVTPLENGEGKVRDVTWTCKLAENEEVITKGEYAIIEKIEGNHLIIKKKQN